MGDENEVSTEERGRRIDSPAGRRLVAAMRTSISRRGIAASTFDRIAPEAEVSRGSIAWYFGTKERLIAEVMRADAEDRLQSLNQWIGEADSVDGLVAAAAQLLDDYLDAERGPHVVVQELGSFAVQNGTVGAVQTEVRRRWRQTLGELLQAKADQGVIELIGDPEGTATLFTALGQGIAAESLADPRWDRSEATRQATEVARALLGAPTAAAGSKR
jgi:AcrR family transcriptional regulator